MFFRKSIIYSIILSFIANSLYGLSMKQLAPPSESDTGSIKTFLMRSNMELFDTAVAEIDTLADSSGGDEINYAIAARTARYINEFRIAEALYGIVTLYLQEEGYRLADALRSSLEKLVNASEVNKKRYLTVLQTSPIAQYETFPQALRDKLDMLARIGKGNTSLLIAYWAINKNKENDLRLVTIAEVIGDKCLEVYAEKNLDDIVKIANRLAALPYEEGPFTANRMADRLLKNRSLNQKKATDAYKSITTSLARNKHGQYAVDLTKKLIASRGHIDFSVEIARILCEHADPLYSNMFKVDPFVSLVTEIANKIWDTRAWNSKADDQLKEILEILIEVDPYQVIFILVKQKSWSSLKIDASSSFGKKLQRYARLFYGPTRTRHQWPVTERIGEFITQAL